MSHRTSRCRFAARSAPPLFPAVCVLVLLLAAAPASAQQHTWTGVERIVAVGDIHGDCDAFVAVLQAATVIDDDRNWIAGKTHLVQLGDVLDRAPDSKGAMDLLMKLEGQAVKAGGRVHALIGNHEAMVLAGDWRFVHPGEFKAMGGRDGFRKAFAADGKYGKWIRSHNAIIKINDSLFLHAGLHVDRTKQTLDQLNDAIRTGLGTREPKGLAWHPRGPLWYRGTALMTGKDLDEDIDAVTKAYGVQRIVIGHTYSRNGVHLRGGGRVLCTDCGISGYYGKHGGRRAAVAIERTKGKDALYLVRPGEKHVRLDVQEAAKNEEADVE
jgi:hypothetical protein